MTVLLAVVSAMAVALALWPAPVRRRPVAAGGPERPLVVDPVVAFELVAVVVAGGASVPAALEALGEACGAGELAVAGRLLRLGAAWDEAVAGLAAPWDGVVDPLRGAWENGTDPGAALRVAGTTVRARRTAHARVAAEKLAVRLMLPLGLCLLPAFVLLGLVPVVLSIGGELLGGW